MIISIQREPQQPLHGPKIGGINKNGPTDIKASTIAKVVIAAIAVAATVAFTITAVLTANPLFFVGTALAVGVLLSLSGVQVSTRVGYRPHRFVDPTFAKPYQKPVRVELVPPYRGQPVQPLRNNFNPMRDNGMRARNVGVPARGNTPVIPVIDEAPLHQAVRFKR